MMCDFMIGHKNNKAFNLFLNSSLLKLLHLKLIKVFADLLKSCMDKLFFSFLESSASVEELPAGCEWSRLSSRLCRSRQTQ